MPKNVVLRAVALTVVLFALGVVGGASGRTQIGQTTIQVQVIGGGLVSGGGQIACGNGSQNCFGTFVTGTDVELTATDQGGWTYSAWTGDCSGGTDDDAQTCTVNLDGGDREVTATFASSSNPGTSTLSVNNTSDSTSDGGNVSGGQIDCDTGDSSCDWEVTTGSTITLLENPDDGYAFNGWGGPCSGTDNVCTVQVGSDMTVNAAFEKSATSFALTVSVTGNGVVAGGGISCTSAGGSSCSSVEAANSTVTLISQPGSGAGFNGWGGACSGTSPSCSVTMNAAQSVTADFSGQGGGGPATDFPLGVSVTGSGSVSGGGIRCGSGETTCTVNQTAGSNVTLTEKPDTGATFQGWGGACTGTAATCSVTMNAAKSVTATFSTAPTPAGQNKLSVTVTGPGTVAGGGIQCGTNGKTCTANENDGSDVTLTATPAANAIFISWDGACSGEETTCTVSMDADKSVSAAFRAAGRTSAGVGSVKKLQITGHAVVRKANTGFRITLRFVTPRRGVAHVRALLAGRLQTALSFPVAPGPATVGPFPVVKPGFYVFEVALGAQRLRWTACLGKCRAAAHAAPFVLVRGPAKAIDAGALWTMTLSYRSTQAAGAQIRVFRSGKLAKDLQFPAPAGGVTAGPFLLSPGTYQLRLTATDRWGRVRKLTWYAVLT
jgi:Divergent InlB B-repeat domain